MSETLSRFGESFPVSERGRRNLLQQLQRDLTQHVEARARSDAQLIASIAGRKIGQICGVEYSNDHILSSSRERYVVLARRWTLFLLTSHPDTSYSLRMLSRATGFARASITCAGRELRVQYKDGRLNQTQRPLQDICDQLARLGWTPFDVRRAL